MAISKSKVLEGVEVGDHLLHLSSYPDPSTGLDRYVVTSLPNEEHPRHVYISLVNSAGQRTNDPFSYSVSDLQNTFAKAPKQRNFDLHRIEVIMAFLTGLGKTDKLHELLLEHEV